MTDLEQIRALAGEVISAVVTIAVVWIIFK